LSREIDARRARGATIVFTNGCFDLLHAGHVSFLEDARRCGDCLVVAINSDASIARLKGPDRPIVPAEQRAAMLTALQCVDHVIIMDADTPHELLRLLHPDVLVKGGTTTDVVGREIVESYGGRVLTLAAIPDISTTLLVNRVTRLRAA
jgi:D-beta-D-heptose 7-phosphate kinase/D-beta-D-heptose 1-phosphate adenosyltransferase